MPQHKVAYPGRVVYLAHADKWFMHPFGCTPQHEMGYLLTLFPRERSQAGHQPEDVWYLEG
jgi:hypothetical protein